MKFYCNSYDVRQFEPYFICTPEFCVQKILSTVEKKDVLELQNDENDEKTFQINVLTLNIAPILLFAVK